MSALNLHSTTGIIYIVLIIVACLVGLWGLNKIKNVLFPLSEKEKRIKESLRLVGGKRRKLKRQRK